MYTKYKLSFWNTFEFVLPDVVKDDLLCSHITHPLYQATLQIVSRPTVLERTTILWLPMGKCFITQKVNQSQLLVIEQTHIPMGVYTHPLMTFAATAVSPQTISPICLPAVQLVTPATYLRLTISPTEQQKNHGHVKIITPYKVFETLILGME